MSAVVVAVSCSATHDFSKPNQESIQLLTGLGVKVDSHSGETVKQRARVALDPNKPNLRQVHLIHIELYDELQAAGFDISAGQMGENITTHGVDLFRATHRRPNAHTRRRCRSDRATQSLLPARQLPPRPNQSHVGPRRGRKSHPKGRDNRHRPIQRPSFSRRLDKR